MLSALDRQRIFIKPGETAYEDDGTRRCRNCGQPFDQPEAERTPHRHNSTHLWNGDWWVCPPSPKESEIDHV